jgi:hypothetical protein
VRLDEYTGVPLTPAMTDKMVQITVEILDILATATQEMKEGRASESNLRLPLLEANIGSGKFLKSVMGRTDLEDGVKKLEKLTNEEIAMASAFLVNITHKINAEVAGAREDVKNVDEKVLVVQSNVQLVNDNVKEVNYKVQAMADGG